MRPVPSLSLSCSILLASIGCAEEPLWPVRATIDDGQVLTGAIQTPELLLEGGLGTLAIPWEDVGEVVPVEGKELADSAGFVSVWLRNGSELTGRWVDPELSMGLEVGGSSVSVDVPVDQLLRLQTQGGEIWPEGVVYRVRTSHGDDFLVDPEASRLVLENEMGRFAPFLSECLSASPLEDPTGDWRVELLNGTVLIGPIVDEGLAFELGLGPGEARVPLEVLVSLERQDWGLYRGLDEGDRLSERLLSAIPYPAARQPAAPVMAYDEAVPETLDQETTALLDVRGYLLPQAGELDPASLEVDGRFRDTGAEGAGAAGIRGGFAAGPSAATISGQGSADGWFSRGDLRAAKLALH
jgi:hypothetical protein